MTDPYSWHKAALAGERPPIHTEPECGWFLFKSQTNGMVPASIFWASPEVDEETGEILSDQELRCEIGGVEDRLGTCRAGATL